jgi:antirestriction protein ArdC
MMAQYARGFDHAIWMTFEQAKEAGGQVSKGAKSEGAILYKTNVKNEGAEDEQVLKYLKNYRVFNVAEIEGLPDHYYQKPAPQRKATTDELHEFISGLNPTVMIHGDMAFYHLEKDMIVMPPRDQFESELEFDMTLLHELSHWTLAPHRCDRKVDLKTHAGRAMEELVAEFTSVLLGMHLGFPVAEKTFDNHVAYLQSWVKNFRDRPDAFLKAAGKAQQAFDWLIAAGTTKTSSDHETSDVIPVQQLAA